LKNRKKNIFRAEINIRCRTAAVIFNLKPETTLKMKESNWKNNDGLKLYAAEWAVKKPKAVIALVHGQGEHIGRYGHLAAWYNEHDIAVAGYDQQGHGRSEGVRGHAPSLESLLDDVELLLEKTRAQYPKAPLFLYGHSMGGNLVLNYALRRQPDLTGLIATGPWIRLAFEAPALKVLAGKILRRIAPKLTLPNGLATEFLSRDPEVVKAYNNDPLVHDKISAAAGIALMEGAHWLDRYSGLFTMPALLMHGGADKITSAPATAALAGRTGPDVIHREWPGLYHEIHNESDQKAVFEFTFDWIEKRI
jgi:alpha-beta hydrolase superfamily lysophospholipase